MRRLSGAQRAPAHEWWPAGEAQLSAEFIALPTGVSIRVIRGGPERGEPVVLVHGWGVHAYLWRRNVEPLIAAGLRVYVIDLPGHGLSDKPLEAGSYTLERMTAHLAAAFAVLGVQGAPVIAQSMGGRVALELARTRPDLVSALVLFGSVGLGRVPRGVLLAPKLPIPRGPLSTMLVQRWMVALSKTIAYGRRCGRC
jgi:pimeloyl-ACP methyl ester carboxylesterase